MISVTPLDVVKIRLQAQRKPQAFTKGHCYQYCNGLMDHTCICLNGDGTTVKTDTPEFKKYLEKQWYKRPGNFSGTLVMNKPHMYIALKSIVLSTVFRSKK